MPSGPDVEAARPCRDCASSSSRTCARIASISAPSSGCEEGWISLAAPVDAGAWRFPRLSEAVVAARVDGLPERRGAGLDRLLGAMCFCARRPRGIVDRA